jgi:hypothetical protein
VARRENLQRRHVLFGTERSEQPDDSVRLQAVFKFVDQEGRRLVRGFPLQGRDQQTRRAQAERPQWYAVLIVKRDGAPCEADRASVDECLHSRADRHTHLGGGCRNELQ